MSSADDRHADPDLTTMHVRQAVDGDAESRSWIVARFTPLLLAQARYRMAGDLGRICEPADVVQDVWLRVLPRLSELSPEERFTPVLVAYLSRAVLFQLNNVMRTALRRRAKGGVDPVGGSAVVERGDDCTGVVSQLARGERRDAVLAAIEALGESDREVIVLRAIEQHDNRAAAAMLGIEPGALAVRYHRALKRLREQLPGSLFDEFTADDEIVDG